MVENGYFELYARTRPITTASAQAQLWFDRGLAWLYGFNHEEATACFREALEFDPSCAMAWWGIAHASGPFYNRPWVRFSQQEIEETLALCLKASTRAAEFAGGCDPREQALISAVATRYPADGAISLDRLNRCQDEFAAAMRHAHRAFPDDFDIAALFVEAAMTRTPRRLWDLRTGQPGAGADTSECLDVLEQALGRMDEDAPHPGLLHMYIHLLEMSPFPEKALRAADRLRDLARDEGHLHHMPAHIYVQCGDYSESVRVSRRAVEADDKYLAYAGADNFYTTARCHDLHLFMFAAMFLGQLGPALYAANRTRSIVTPELVQGSWPFMASILDGYSAMRVHVLVRFGKWRDLVTETPPVHPELMPVSVAMHAYGQGVANAALGRIEEAETARRAFDSALGTITEDAIFLSNRTSDILAVGAAMLDGELEYRKRNYDHAFASLRRAVDLDDDLNYTEPWAWMHPPRHALGALLLEQGRFEEAEMVYRTDLGLVDGLARCCQHPDNVWALHGLLECVERKNGGAETRILRQRLEFAKAKTDVPIAASCCCRTGA